MSKLWRGKSVTDKQSLDRILEFSSLGLQLLLQAGEAGNVPALKGFALIASSIVEVCKSAVSNKEECRLLAEDVYGLTTAVVNQLPQDTSKLDAKFLQDVKKLCSKLEEIDTTLKGLSKRPSRGWLLRNSEDGVVLRRCRTDVTHALDIFSVNSHVQMERTLRRSGTRMAQRNKELLDVIRQVRQEELGDILEAEKEQVPPRTDISTALLPPPPRIFFGREEEISLLISTLVHNVAARMAIIGTAGIGKSSLAARILHDPQIVTIYNTRRFFVSCDSATDKDGLLTAIARHLNIRGKAENQLMALLGKSKKPTILILDNFETPWEPSGSKKEVEEFLSTLADLNNLALIVTMRGSERPGRVAWTRPTIPPLKPLNATAARCTFIAISGRPEDDPHIDELVKVVDYVPLAVTLMATLAQSDNTETLLFRWSEERSSMLHRTSDRRTSLDVSIEISVRSPRMLSTPEAQELLALLSWLPDGIEDRKLESIFPNLTNCRMALSTLRQTSLAFWDGNDRTRVLAPIRAYMLSHHQCEEVHTLSMMSYYIAFAGLSTEIGRPHGQAVVRRLTSEIGNMHSVVNFALGPGATVGTGVVREAVKAAIDLSRFSRYTNLGDTTPINLAIAAAERLDDSFLRAEATFHLSFMLPSRKPLTEVVCNQALGLYQDIGSISGQAECTWLLGQILKTTGRGKECRDVFEKALALSKESGNLHCQAKCLSALSETAFYRGNVDTSESQCREALQIYRAEESMTNVGLCLYWLGRIAETQSAYSLAMDYLTESLQFLEMAGAELETGRVFAMLGDVAYARCDYTKATSGYQRALEIYRDHGYSEKVVAGFVQLSLGIVAVSLYDADAATNWLNGALSIFRNPLDKYGVMHCQICFGDLAFQDGRYDEARAYYSDVWRACHSVYADEEGRINVKMGILAQAESRIWAASRHHIIGFAIYRNMANSIGQAAAMSNLAETLLGDETETALTLYTAIRPIYEKLGATRGVADCLLGMSKVLENKDRTQSNVFVTEAHRLYSRTADRRKEKICEEILARLA